MISSRTGVLQTVFLFGSLPLLAMGAVAAALMPFVGPIGVVLLTSLISGVCLIICSKLHAKKRSKSFFEWGPKSMNSAEKVYYLLGYILCVFSFLSSMVIYITGMSRL